MRSVVFDKFQNLGLFARILIVPLVHSSPRVLGTRKYLNVYSTMIFSHVFICLEKGRERKYKYLVTSKKIEPRDKRGGFAF